MFLPLDLSPTRLDRLTELSRRHGACLANPVSPFPTVTLQAELREALKEALFAQPGFPALWAASRSRAKTVYLSHPRNEIRNLPWQLATEERPLLAIVKTGESDLEDYTPRVGYPLRVLVMVSAPEGVTRLAYEEEELNLLRAFSPLMAKGLVQVHFTDDGSLENLQEQLEENQYHILHYSGHGSYREGEGFLSLEDRDTGAQREVSAEEFNGVLAKVGRKGHRPDLIVLSGCQTARGVASGEITGVANLLLAGGTPAVVAMSDSISDNCATLFAGHFYAELCDDYPLAAAFQEARLAVRRFEISSYPLADRGLAPAQWLIPQLLVTAAVERLIDPSTVREELDFRRDTEYVRGERGLLALRVRPPGYLFVGRRKQRREALRALYRDGMVLLRGQGGVGKTALAENLAVRRLAADARTKVFTISETKNKAEGLIAELTEYVKEQRSYDIDGELAALDTLTERFAHLLHRVDDHCAPLFLFDNVETFQQYDSGRRQYVWKATAHADLLELLTELHRRGTYPVVITGRYPLAEFPDVRVVNLNTVPFSDYFRKCHQLEVRKIDLGEDAGAMNTSTLKRAKDAEEPLSFEGMVRLLYEYLGSNYRSLEFFDELYVARGEAVIDTLRRLAALPREAAVPDEDAAGRELREEVIHEMGRNLVFGELVDLLSSGERDVLGLLTHFNIPVLPMAIGMQREGLDPTPTLSRLVGFTLTERRMGTDGRERFYVIPLVRQLLMGTELANAPFDHLGAGEYHHYVFDNDLEENWIVEASEAFDHYYSARSTSGVSDFGNRLCRFYYKQQQFQMSFSYGRRTEDVAGEQTPGSIWNNLGLILQLFGQLDGALIYFEKSRKDDIKRKDRRGEGTTLNNISQIYQAQGDYATALTYLTDSLKIRQDIGDRRGEATTLHNMGTIQFGEEDFAGAVAPLLRAYQILGELGSPNQKHPESYLNAIIEKIGQPRFEEIIQNLPQDQ